MIPMNFDLITEGTTAEKLSEESSRIMELAESIGSTLFWFIVRAVIAVIVYLIIRKILHRMLSLMDRILESRGVESTIRHFVLGVLKLAVLTVTVMIIITKLDIVEASTIAAVIAACSVGISLAMQGAVSNLTGSLLIMLFHPFREGDYISVRDTDAEGVVDKIGVYYTNIRTVYNEVIAIPNSQLTGHAVVNMISGSRKRLTVKVGVSYGEDLKKAEAVMQKLMEEEPRFLPESRRVFVDELGESSVVVGIRALVKTEDYADTLWDMNEKIRLRFIEEGIEIPFNQLDIHIKS